MPERTSLDAVGVYLVEDFENIVTLLALLQVWKATTQNVFLI
jgi:hypothetical protein